MNTERPTPAPCQCEICLEQRRVRALERELAEAREENTKLRAALAMSDQPCVYCTLPADEMGRCKVGFPGCPRADDQMGCPHLGAALELNEAREELARLKAQPQPLPRPDKPGWWWCWDDDDEEWVCHQIGSITWAWSGLWLPATPPPAPEKGVEG